jgi:hypothetical protein
MQCQKQGLYTVRAWEEDGIVNVLQQMDYLFWLSQNISVNKVSDHGLTKRRSVPSTKDFNVHRYTLCVWGPPLQPLLDASCPGAKCLQWSTFCMKFDVLLAVHIGTIIRYVSFRGMVMSLTHENAAGVHSFGKGPLTLATKVGIKHIDFVKHISLYHCMTQVSFSFIIRLQSNLCPALTSQNTTVNVLPHVYKTRLHFSSMYF